MANEYPEPSENDSIDCHLQQIGVGGLICRAAKQTGDKATNETNPIVCFNCPAGKVFRDVGCDAISPNIQLYHWGPGIRPDIRGLFCKIRKRTTTPEFCKTCGLAVAETTRENVTVARGLFQSGEFYAAYKDIEAAREGIRDGKFEHAITRSISCLESVMRSVHEKLKAALPDKMTVTDLWKSVRGLLRYEECDQSGAVTDLMNTLSGLVSKLGAMRNTLGDAHGRGTAPPAVSESFAELALNVAAALATAIIRRFKQCSEAKNGHN
jgi:hypothetical protein